MNYFGVVHKEADSAFGMHFPDLPGCFAAADLENDLMANAIVAIDDFLSDQANIPDARRIAEISAEAAEDLAEGAYLLAVPYIPRDTVTERVNVSFERGMLQAIDEHAEQIGVKNRSAYLALAAKKLMSA